MSCAILFSSCILVTLKFIAGQQTCRTSLAEKGLKDWAIVELAPGVNVMITSSIFNHYRGWFGRRLFR
jgi:hypothetical protein